ncbi:MAG: hypothetical protein U0S50_10835 [Sphingopyxis sp.]|uniref:hypothetical protein n=1 Tax=Sphingopyxis sp. TaxID=1908224 RepID=UPI002AB90162|nr:hypothetical protein [Sphingopyxis sp.]MDZ3832301.1 hypothetical protein [Sphingopyxis sp.]
MAADTSYRRPPAPPPTTGGAQAEAMAGSFWGGRSGGASSQDGFADPEPATSGGKAPPATETIGRRAGSLSDELDFPEFVASLIHGTWDAMVDSSIRQMDAYADLVAAISKPVEQFREENVTAAQARDWLAAQHPAELSLYDGGGGKLLSPRPGAGGETSEPMWLADYGLEGQELTPDLIEEQLVPVARDRMARDRMQTLATLVMLGLNRIKVDNGSITARLRFRAAAADKTSVDYAVSDDPSSAAPSGSWSTRGSTSYAAPVTKVSTVGVNAQTDSNLNAELFGEVKINFSSETLPLDRFVDDARRTMLERAARPPAAIAPPPSAPQPSAAPAAPASPQPAAPLAPVPGAVA